MCLHVACHGIANIRSAMASLMTSGGYHASIYMYL